MKRIVLGTHPWTSLLGLTAGVLVYLQQLIESGQNDVWKIAIAVALYFLGRVASDAGISQTSTQTTTTTDAQTDSIQEKAS